MALVAHLNDFLWNGLLLFLLLGVGIYFTVVLRFVQIRRFGPMVMTIFNTLKKNKTSEKGISPLQGLTTAMAAQVGTGNLAGAASAILLGGPGSIFWMWVSSFFGMATIYAEATLSQLTKVKTKKETLAGPVYYIKKAFPGKFGTALSKIFALLVIFALTFCGNMVQGSAISVAFREIIDIPSPILGVLLAILCLSIFLGGTKRIAKLTERIVPPMAGIFVLASIVIILLHVENILPAFRMIFVGALSPDALLGGALGVGIRDALRYGIARGLFSNEAGMGSTPHAHGVAEVKYPAEQGEIAMLGVFIDSFVILTLTALVILTTIPIVNVPYDGIEMAQMAFYNTFGDFGTLFIAVSIFFFAITSIVGWFFFGVQNVKFLFGHAATGPFALMVSIAIAISATMSTERVFQLADLMNGFIVIPNLLALLILAPHVKKAGHLYDTSSQRKRRP